MDKVDFAQFYDISLFIRHASIRETLYLSGQWKDPDNVFTYIAQGSAEFILDGIKYLVSEGDAIIMHPFMPHIILTNISSSFIQYVIHFDLHFDPNRMKIKFLDEDYINLDEIIDKEMLFKTIQHVSSINILHRRKIQSLFLEMTKSLKDCSPESHLVAKFCFTEIIYLYLKSLDNKHKSITKETKGWIHIKKAITYINQKYYSNNIDNNEISNYVGVTPSYLINLFREQLGIPLHKYLTYVRIQKAKYLLEKGDLTISEIAYKTGFLSIHSFSKIFKRETGLSPSSYTSDFTDSIPIEEILDV